MAIATRRPQRKRNRNISSHMNVRRAVKASHTGTGLGSMLAFLTTSQIYNQFGVYGVAYLGISIQTVKILVNVIIDLDFHVRNRKVEA